MADGSELAAVARVKFVDGRVEDFKRVAAQVIESIRAKDSGTLQYEIYLNDDESECVFLERYRDLDAMVEHNANLGDLLAEMLGTGAVTAELFVSPTDEIRAKFAGFPIQFFSPFASK